MKKVRQNGKVVETRAPYDRWYNIEHEARHKGSILKEEKLDNIQMKQKILQSEIVFGIFYARKRKNSFDSIMVSFFFLEEFKMGRINK